MNPLAARNAVSRALDAFPADGGLRLQVCADCATVQYPPREICRACLGDSLDWRHVDGMGTVLATSALHHSLEECFRSRLPWQVASVVLDAGPVVIVHIERRLARAGARLRVANARDAAGSWCLAGVDADVADAGEALATTLEALGLCT